jgi:hypothetical protein
MFRGLPQESIGHTKKSGRVVSFVARSDNHIRKVLFFGLQAFAVHKAVLIIMCRKIVCFSNVISSSVFPYLNLMLGLCPAACLDWKHHKLQLQNFAQSLQLTSLLTNECKFYLAFWLDSKITRAWRVNPRRHRDGEL